MRNNRKRLAIADMASGFLTYAEFFARLGGEGTPVHLSASEKKDLVGRLSQIGGRPRYIFDGVREDILETAEVKECCRYPDGRLYVRYEVQAMMRDCSWDGPHELLSVWNADGRLESYTFVHGSGRNTAIAATLHLVENEDGVDDEYVEEQSIVLCPYNQDIRVAFGVYTVPEAEGYYIVKRATDIKEGDQIVFGGQTLTVLKVKDNWIWNKIVNYTVAVK